MASVLLHGSPLLKHLGTFFDLFGIGVNQKNTLPETKSSHLQMDDLQLEDESFLFDMAEPGRCELLVSGSVLEERLVDLPNP